MLYITFQWIYNVLPYVAFSFLFMQTRRRWTNTLTNQILTQFSNIATAQDQYIYCVHNARVLTSSQILQGFDDTNIPIIIILCRLVLWKRATLLVSTISRLRISVISHLCNLAIDFWEYCCSPIPFTHIHKYLSVLLAVTFLYSVDQIHTEYQIPCPVCQEWAILLRCIQAYLFNKLVNDTLWLHKLAFEDHW